MSRTSELNRQARQRPSGRDGFDQHLHSHTQFMAGTGSVFRRTARYILDMAFWQPDPDHPQYQQSATLHPADGHFATAGQGIYLTRWR